MSSYGSVRTHVVPLSGTVRPTDLVSEIRQCARRRGLKTVIVTHNNKPVGVIRWSDIERAEAIPAPTLARDIMMTDFPILTPDTPVIEARSVLEIVEMDQLPVVTSQGRLAGLVARDALKEAMAMENEREGLPERERESLFRPRQAFNIRPGMNVYSSDGVNLGLVNRMFLENGKVMGFLVTHDALGRSHKQLQFDVVDHLDGESIILSITNEAFRELADARSRDA
jgi:CBS domain-containing protein